MRSTVEPTIPTTVDDAFDARRAWLGALIIFVLTLIVYWPAMHAGYIWDDNQYVSENRLLQQGVDGLRDIWIPRKTPQYYPIVFTTFWIEHQVWGLNPHGYHIVNILIHAISSILVWRLARMLKIPWAWLIGAIFALHPVHVESVAWITERKNTLSALFYLLAAITYLKFDQQQHDLDSPPMSRWGVYALSMALFVLALLSKSVTCSLPAALILMMLWQRKPMSVKRLAPLVPMLIIGVMFALNTANIEREHVGAFGEDFQFSIADRLLIASNALLFYAGKILWPWPVIFIYPRWNIDDSQPLQYWPLAAVIVIAIVLLVMYLRGKRGPGLALAFFAGTVFPALGFVNIYPMVFSFVADHFQYLASLGVIALMVAVLTRAVRTRERMILASIAVLAPLGMITFWQAGAYADAETLYRDTIGKNPDAFMAHNNLATELLRQAEDARDAGDQERAAALVQRASGHLAEALRIKPRYRQALQNMSELLAMRGEDEEALKLAQQALDIITARPDIQEILRGSGRPPFPPIAEAFASVAQLQSKTNRLDEARRNYAEAIAWNPADLDVRREYAAILFAAGDMSGTAAQYEAILSLAPEDMAALANLAAVRERQGQYADARALLERAGASAGSPGDRVGMTLRMIRLLSTAPDPSVRDTKKALALADALVRQTRRQDPAMLSVLSDVLAANGRIIEAIKTGDEAANLAQQLRFDDLAKDIRSRVDRLRTQLPTATTSPQ